MFANMLTVNKPKSILVSENAISTRYMEHLFVINNSLKKYGKPTPKEIYIKIIDEKEICSYKFTSDKTGRSSCCEVEVKKKIINQ